MNNQLTYIISGAGVQLVLFIGYTFLRNPKIYWTILILTIGLAAFGYLNMDRPNLEMVKGNAAAWTFLPLLFLIYFGVFRQIFLNLYKNEPLITGYMQTSWEQNEYRRLHFGDAAFTILILILPFITTLLL
jgi:cytochrome b561